MSILADILAVKRKEVAAMRESADVPRCNRRSFVEVLCAVRPAFIAEIKPKSPSAGELLSPEAIPVIVETYGHCASAISVLCDKTFFGGGYDLLADVAGRTEKPLLAKEFVISERQIEQAVLHGASAVLLIAAITGPDMLIKLIRSAARMNCDVLLELHTDEDVRKASTVFNDITIEERSRIVFGINNRNLATLAISLETTKRLTPLVREKIGTKNMLIAESGISSPEDVRALSHFVDGFLIGTSLLQSPDPDVFFFSLQHACDRK